MTDEIKKEEAGKYGKERAAHEIHSRNSRSNADYRTPFKNAFTGSVDGRPLCVLVAFQR